MAAAVLRLSAMYYEDKVGTLRDLFGTTDVSVKPEGVLVDGWLYPVIDDVIVLLPPEQRTPRVRRALGEAADTQGDDAADPIQASFGEEWTRYDAVLPEHRDEFARYVDLLDPAALTDARVCDLGCGNGRWSVFLQSWCRELVLVDFSDAIFAARRNVTGDRALFFMGDLRALPFRDDCADLVVCLGVLHHLPTPCLEMVRRLRRVAPRLLAFLYYAFDNRPPHYRWLLPAVTALRFRLSRIRAAGVRRAWTKAALWLLYLPLIGLGWLARPIGLASWVPLHEFYRDKSLRRIEQDVYDRLFTAIEQRVTRAEIEQLRDTFAEVRIAAGPPYWHFLCVR